MSTSPKLVMQAKGLVKRYGQEFSSVIPVP